MKTVLAVLIVLFLLTALFRCGDGTYKKSGGTKYGLLQKVSHKTTTCDYYVMEVAFEGGRAVGQGDGSVYENSQSFEITKAAYDTLAEYVGDHVSFQYEDRPYASCGEDKFMIKLKKK